MTPLARHMAKQIRTRGPISVSDFMAQCLGDPVHGYYMTRDPLGSKGDFTTAPEISQMFGELLGLWCVDMWMKLGEPSAFTFAELGPGRGTLMADALRAARRVPGFAGAARIVLVETSPVLRAAQQTRVQEANWVARVEDLPDTPLILIANEFFDALPIRQFIRQADGWVERRVGLDQTSSDEEPSFSFTTDTTPIDPLQLPEGSRNAPVGSIAETCPLGTEIAKNLAARLTLHTGATLFIDYGHTKSAPGDTLQAVRQHKFVSILDAPGDVDLTAHVDFETLARAMNAVTTYRPVPQGAFLKALGIDVRADHLKTKANPAQAHEIDLALTRLTSPKEMGNLFKIMAATSLGIATPEGF